MEFIVSSKLGLSSLHVVILFNRSPLSVIPIDLIVIQVGIPALVKYFQPKQAIKTLFVASITWTCRQLRLTSFMFGGRKPEEEGTLTYHTWSAWLKRSSPSHYPAEGSAEEDVIGPEVSYLWDGQLMRVPRHDSVPIIDRRRMLVPVDAVTLEPIDDRERELGHPAASAPGGNEVNTVIVYTPPHFKQRVLIFLGFMWFSISVFCCMVTIVPVILGRALFKQGFGVENDVHDIYSFVLGGFLLLLAGMLANQSYKALKDIYLQTTWKDICTSIWRHTKQWNLWVSN
jgi:E3 ubiquitin-protein ligase MARCH6